MLSTHQAQECWVRSIEKNPSSTLVRDEGKIEYISEGQLSPYELTFGVELDPNSHSKKKIKYQHYQTNVTWIVICTWCMPFPSTQNRGID